MGRGLVGSEVGRADLGGEGLEMRKYMDGWAGWRAVAEVGSAEFGVWGRQEGWNQSGGFGGLMYCEGRVSALFPLAPQAISFKNRCTLFHSLMKRIAVFRCLVTCLCMVGTLVFSPPGSLHSISIWLRGFHIFSLQLAFWCESVTHHGVC